ncbi:MAG: hypothetical protein ACJAS7_000195 [Alpinimonas sp.]|jgi:hypothetical protein
MRLKTLLVVVILAVLTVVATTGTDLRTVRTFFAPIEVGGSVHTGSTFREP